MRHVLDLEKNDERYPPSRKYDALIHTGCETLMMMIARIDLLFASGLYWEEGRRKKEGRRKEGRNRD